MTASTRIPFIDDQAVEKREASIVAWLEELYTRAKALREQQEPEWITNILFLAGNQQEQARTDLRLLTRRIPTVVPETHDKLTINVIYAMERQAAAAFRDHLARQIAVPATREQEDIDAAEIGTDFLTQREYNQHDDEPDLRLREVLWAMNTGICARATAWDSRISGYTKQGKIDGLGDLSTRCVNPFRFHLCPWPDDTSDVPWLIESDVRDISELNDVYPGHDVKAEEYASAMDALDRLALNIVEARDLRTTHRTNAAVLKCLYIAPRSDLPQGRRYIWADGKLLFPSPGEEAGAVLSEGEMPYVLLRWFPIPGRIYPLPFVSPLRDLQKQINLTVSQLVELKNRQLRGDYAFAGSGTPVQKTSKATGQKRIQLPANTSHFEFMQYNLNTSEAEILLERFWNYFMQIGGLHEQALGANPAKAVTATQVALLKESDLAGLTLFRSGFDAAYSKVARMKILLAKNHYDTPRLLRVVGEDNQPRKVGAFFGSDLRNTEDVRPRPVPVLSEFQKQEIRQNAVAQGLFTASPDPVEQLAKIVALRATGLPGIEEEIEGMLAPMTEDELKKICGELNGLRWQTAVELAKTELAQLTAAQQQMQTPQEPTTDDYGNPVEQQPMQAPPGQPQVAGVA